MREMVVEVCSLCPQMALRELEAVTAVQHMRRQMDWDWGFFLNRYSRYFGGNRFYQLRPREYNIEPNSSVFK
jgi:hypothetical protein